MRRNIFALAALLCVIMVSGCASKSALRSEHASYQYDGAKYGKVLIVPAEEVQKDARKASRIEEMMLDKKIIVQLRAAGIYDEASPDSIHVQITSISIRNTFNAIMFGAMAGTDNMSGTVTLKNGNADRAVFDVKASYGLGGTGGGQDSLRLGWLADTFAEHTIKIIMKKNPS